MSAERQTITTDQLAIGMYVAELDRPWLETPFLFQGFYIENAKDISELQEHCQHVLVDPGRVRSCTRSTSRRGERPR